jgi:iron complex transport system permease protein
MRNLNRIKLALAISTVILPVFFVLDLMVGQIQISFVDIWNSLFGQVSDETISILIKEFRFPKAMVAIIAGASLSIAGMFMQTLFQNPLAGPYVLGINAGASLMVALSMLTGISFFYNEYGMIASALIGAFSVGALMMIIATNLRNTVALLLVGLMLGSFISAFINLLEVGSTADSLKRYALWSMGSLQQVSFSQIPVISLVFMIGFTISFFFVKPLNLLLLGENAAGNLGLNVKFSRLGILFVTALLSGLTTAFCGPIAFVGLAIPNVTRMLLKTRNHAWLLIGNAVFGALFLLICDVFIQLISGEILVPINVLTSLFGAPFVIYLVTRKRL